MAEQPFPHPVPVPQLGIQDAYHILATVIQDAPIPLRDHNTVLLALQVVAQFIRDNQQVAE